MQRSTIVFLILLRLAIGWHFLVEGGQKLQSTYLIGETVTNKPFSSAGYFREAPGPLGQAIRAYEGDADTLALARLTIDPESKAVPAPLAADLKIWLERTTKHYGLDEAQQTEANAKLTQAEAKVVEWLTYTAPKDQDGRDSDPRYALLTNEITRTYPSGEVKRRMTASERIAEYREKLANLKDLTDRKLWVFGKDVEGTNLRAAKAEVAKVRSELLADLAAQTKPFEEDINKLLSEEQKALGSFPTPKPFGMIEFVDMITPWMLTGIGLFLLIGLLARLAAIGAIGFLFMTYLAVPAMPWYPAAGPSEGNYLFINKNVIEMLALCVIATTPTGKWFGVDAIFYAIGKALFGSKEQKTA